MPRGRRWRRHGHRSTRLPCQILGASSRGIPRRKCSANQRRGPGGHGGDRHAARSRTGPKSHCWLNCARSVHPRHPSGSRRHPSGRHKRVRQSQVPVCWSALSHGIASHPREPDRSRVVGSTARVRSISATHVVPSPPPSRGCRHVSSARHCKAEEGRGALA